MQSEHPTVTTIRDYHGKNNSWLLILLKVPCSWVLLVKPIVAQLLENIQKMYESSRLATDSCSQPDKSIPHHLILFPIVILILFSNLCLDLHDYLLYSGFPKKILHGFSFSPIHATFLVHPLLLCLISDVFLISHFIAICTNIFSKCCKAMYKGMQKNAH
jgi:hypothetical protein